MIPLLLTTALAAPGEGSIGVLVGTGTAFDGDPASLRLSVRGEVGPYGKGVGASFLMPVTVATRGSDGFGVSSRNTLLELPPSLRLRFLPDQVVSIYGDVGAGLAIATQDVDTWIGSYDRQATAFMTRLGAGLEIGDPEGLTFVVEPASLSTYHTSDATRATYGLMLGLSAHL